MKSITTLFAIVSAVSLFAAPAKQKVDIIGRIVVDCNTASAPIVSYRTSVPSYGPKTTTTNRNWLVISVNFTPGVSSEKGARAKVEKLVGGWADGVVMNVCVAFPSGKKAYGFMTGRTVFQSLPLNARPRTAIMLIPPQTLDRYLPLRGSSGMEVIANKRDFIVEVVFLDRKGKELGRGYYGNLLGRKLDEQIAKFEALKDGKRGSEIKGVILSKDKTPWAFVNYDSYDLIKTDSVASGK
jgi:hypothetical protein